MKELTIEEKAKSFNEALSRAKGFYKRFPELSDILEKIFPELREPEDERIKEWIMKELESKYVVDNIVNNVMADKALAWLEKQGEQKPAEKVEPRFKVGDWVIDKQGIVHQIANVIENVTNHTYAYDIVGGGYFNDNTEGVTLWTIQDAKDGDVLVTGKKNIFIFKSISGYTIYDYCGLFFGEFTEYPSTVNGTGAKQLPKDYVPATKEQCAALMKAMSDAGYTFDFEKKELKKIEQNPVIEMKTPEESLGVDSDTYNKIVDECVYGEQNPTWGEEDEQMYNTIANSLNRDQVERVWNTTEEEVVNWLKSLKHRLQPKVEWSEEDNSHIHSVVAFLGECKGYHPTDINIRKVNSDIDWLKSLRPQNRWKPSDEQMKAINDITVTGCISYAEQGQELIHLCNDLKKLKE